MCYPAAQRDSAAELLTAGVHRELLQSDMRACSPERDDSVVCEPTNGFQRDDIAVSDLPHLVFMFVADVTSDM